MLTATGYFAQRLADDGIDAPTSQSALMYVLLSLYGIVSCCLRRTQLLLHVLGQLPSTASAPAAYSKDTPAGITALGMRASSRTTMLR